MRSATHQRVLAIRYSVIKTKGRDRHGQGRAEKQSGSQEAEKRQDQDNCRGAKSEDRWMAADNRLRQKEIAGYVDRSGRNGGSCGSMDRPGWAGARQKGLFAKIDTAQNDAGRISLELPGEEFP